MGQSSSVMSKPRRGDKAIGRSAGTLSPADAGLIVNQHQPSPTAFAVGHNLLALRASEEEQPDASRGQRKPQVNAYGAVLTVVERYEKEI